MIQYDLVMTEKYYKSGKYTLTYKGLWHISEDSAFFAVKPTICNNGVYSGVGEFEIRVSLPCLEMEDGTDYVFEVGLSEEQIEKAVEYILREL